jgi:polysaccharide pyruvyl transferase WcaK-like protein
MKAISVFDTSIADFNLGNQIIMEAVYKHLYEIFPDDFFYKIGYMDITAHSISYLKKSDLVFFGGTNSLCGHMEKYTQWGIDNKNVKHIDKRVILMGLGWWQYQDTVSDYTLKLLKNSINPEFVMSVRDQYTADKLKLLGFENVINTGCPTLWDLTSEHCKDIPDKVSSETAVVTLTDYNKNIPRDRKMLDAIRKHYKKIAFWTQGIGDYSYIKNELKLENVKILPPNLHSFDTFLEKEKPDYIGTRLHGGIRALQKKCRTVIVSVDNRAIEMSENFNLPVVDINQIDKSISSTFCKINIPVDKINSWKKQFNDKAEETDCFPEIPNPISKKLLSDPTKFSIDFFKKHKK